VHLAADEAAQRIWLAGHVEMSIDGLRCSLRSPGDAPVCSKMVRRGVGGADSPFSDAIEWGQGRMSRAASGGGRQRVERQRGRACLGVFSGEGGPPAPDIRKVGFLSDGARAVESVRVWVSGRWRRGSRTQAARTSGGGGDVGSQRPCIYARGVRWTVHPLVHRVD